MRFQTQLLPARLIRRYKRFLADCTLDDGREVTAHCANPGSMMGLAEPGSKIWLEPNDDPKKKLKFGWRLVDHENGHFTGVDTALPNRAVKAGLQARKITALADYDQVRAEVKYGENSRVDFLLTAEHVKAWERAHGEIHPGEWVVMRTDWDKRAHDKALFLNEDPDPHEDGSHSPGPSTECIDYLLSKGIVGWGTQCIGTDAGMAGKFSPPYPAHNYLHRDNCFGLASLCNLDQLPPKGAI